jgi:hypothetical protein
MTDRAQDTRRTRPGRRAAAIAAAAVGAAAIGAAVAVLAAAVPGPAGSALAAPRAMPRAMPAAPASWAPVPYRHAQLSVPGMWLVESRQQFWCGFSAGRGGMIFVGSKPEVPKGNHCSLTASLAWIRPAAHIPPGIRHWRPTAVIHGVPVYRRPSAAGSVLYLVPELGVRVGVRGPLTRRVLATLTRSPLSVVLRRGPASPVPARWVWNRFGGVRFATPRSWRLQRENHWATCGTGLEPGSLLLIDATRPPVYLPCPIEFPAAAAERAQPGLTVVTGKYAAKSVGEDFARCRVRSGVRICLSTVTGHGGFFSSVLIFSVARPGQHNRTFFLLGLPGSGARPRAVYDSVMAAGH